MLLTKGFHAEQQRRDTREKSMRGKRQRVRAGLILATHSPLYGYLWPDDRKSRYVINPEIAPIVQRIFQDVLRGLSTYEIAVALNEEGVLTPLHYQYTRKGKAPPARGAEWQDRTVYAIVTNPVYYGNYEAFKTQKVRKERENVLTGQRERYQVQTPSTEEARVSLPDVAPLIVSREAWESANAQLSHNKLTSARRNTNPDETLLRGGFIRCGLCHKKLYVAHKHYRPADGTVVDYPYYVCAGRSQVGTRHCPGVSIRADIFDKRVWEVMLEKIRNPQPIVDAARQEMDLKDASYTVQSHRGVVKRLEEQVKGFARLMAARVTETGETDEILLQQYDALHVQLRNAKKKLAGVERELEQQRDAKEQLDNLVGWCRAVTEHSAEMTYYQKRIVLRVFGFVIDLPDNTHEANPYFLMTAKRSSGAVPSIVDKYYMNSTIKPQMLLEVDDRDDWEQDLSPLTDLHSSWRIF